MKSAKTRLEDTISFIKTHEPNNFEGDFELICQWLDAWNRTAPETTRKKVGALLTQEDNPNRPKTEVDRSYNRAAALVKIALIEPESRWTAAAQSVRGYIVGGDTPPAAGYKYNLDSANDAIYSSPGLATQHLTQLRTNTRAFLNEYKLIVNGGNKGQGPLE